MEELQIKNKRHGLKSKSKICHVQFIGMVNNAIAANGIAKPFKQIVEYATARVAVLDV